MSSAADSGSSVLSNPKHEAFAQALAAGTPARAAYKAAYPKASAATCANDGPRLAKTDKVKARLKTLRAIASRAVSERVAWERADSVAKLIEIIQTPVGMIDETHPLCQEFTRETSESGAVKVKIKMPPKLEALKEINRMLGFHAPEKVEVSVMPPEARAALDRVFASSPASGAAKGKGNQ